MGKHRKLNTPSLRATCPNKILTNVLCRQMFFVAYDDGGGFYDHVTPPFGDVPDPAADCHVPQDCSGHSVPFDFKR